MEAEEIKERLLAILEELRPYAPSYPLIGNMADRAKAFLEEVPAGVLRKVLREVRELLESA